MEQRACGPNRNGTVVLVKMDGIGDFILFLDAARALRELYNNKKLFLCCSRRVEAVASNTGYFDRVYCFEREDFFEENIEHTFDRIQELKCELLLHPSQPRHVFAEILCYLINADKKIASLGETGGMSEDIKAECDTIYDEMIDQGIENMALIQSANFIRGLGFEAYRARIPKIENVKKYPIHLPEDYFIIFLGGSIYHKLWYPEYFNSIAEYIHTKTGWDCVLCGDRFDEEQERVFGGGEFTNYYSYVGRTKNIDEVVYIISKSHVVVGNDTSAIHIANALQIPSLCIAGQFAGKKFYPYTPEIEENNGVLPIAVTHDVDCSGCIIRHRDYECIGGDYFAHKKLKCVSGVSYDNVKMNVDALLYVADRRRK